MDDAEKGMNKGDSVIVTMRGPVTLQRIPSGKFIVRSKNVRIRAVGEFVDYLGLDPVIDFRGGTLGRRRLVIPKEYVRKRESCQSNG